MRNTDATDILFNRKSGSVSDILNEKYLDRFTVRESPRMFDLDDETKLIKQGICPICSCRLKVSLKGDVYCNSKKHISITRDKLFITKSGMDKLNKTKQ